MVFLYTSIKICEEIHELTQESVYEAGRGYKFYLSDNFLPAKHKSKVPNDYTPHFTF